MTQVKFDDAALALVNGLTEPAAVVDESGTVVGFYTPAVKPGFTPPPEDRCPYSPEELQRMRNSGKGGPLKDLWRKLGAE
jgi:hypothetical protein